jgi:hypothetical protein
VKEKVRKWKIVKNEPKDISGHYRMKLGASELCHDHVNCERVLSNLIPVT